MSDGNPLVAAPVDTATPFSGAGILDSGTQLASAIESGDWVAGGLAAFGTALDAAATLSDPFGSLLAAGLGWLMDHFEPLKGWLNDLTGDAGEVQGFAQTWANAAKQLQASGQELTRVVGDVDELAGEAIEAYRRFQADAAQHINGAAEWAAAMSTGLSIASSIVQVVHDLVRDVIAQLVGSAISWAAEVVFSLTLATPWVIEQVATRVASLAEKVGSKLTKLLESVKALSGLLEKLKALLSKADELFKRVLKGRSSNVRTVDDFGKDKMGFLRSKGVAEEDIQALRYYTTQEGHSRINSALRGPDPIAADLQSTIDGALRAMDALPDYKGLAVRGETIRPGETWLDGYQTGAVVRRDSFTSSDLVRPFDGNVQYTIRSVHGKELGNVSHYFPVEDEVLFRPGTYFDVLDRTEKNGLIEILLSER